MNPSGNRAEPEIVDDPPRLPPRDPRGHKGTFGTVLVVGGHASLGARVMLGAPALAGSAALRGGAGLAVLATPAPLLPSALALCSAATGVALPVEHDGTLDASGAAEAIDRVLAGADVVVLGPGLGNSFAEQQVVARLVALDATPIVLDADGLNALASLDDFARDVRAPLVVTPHPGEFARLAEPLSIAGDPTDPAERPRLAAEMARRLGAIVVLKGPGTIVSDGLRVWTNATGNAALATGGSGDVLAGLVGGMIAQFARQPFAQHSLFDCARLAVLVHGLAADAWSARHGTAGMLPSDLLGEIPDVLHALRAS